MIFNLSIIRGPVYFQTEKANLDLMMIVKQLKKNEIKLIDWLKKHPSAANSMRAHLVSSSNQNVI